MTKIAKLSEVAEIISGIGHLPNSSSGNLMKLLHITDLQNFTTNTSVFNLEKED